MKKDKEEIKVYGFIYITTNLINGKKYIGKRKYYKGWEKYLGSGTYLKSAIKKYGKENFTREILQECVTSSELNDAEIKWIEYYNANENELFYNISTGGDGCLNGEKHPLFGKKHKLSTKKKMAEKAKLRTGALNPFYGKSHTDEAKLKMRDSATNRQKSISERMSISKRTKGENNPMYGKKHSLESKELNRLAHLGKKAGIEARLKMSENNSKKRKVICITTGEIFESLTLAGFQYNTATTNIIKCCKGKSSYAGTHPITDAKLVWMYLEDYEKHIKEQNNEKLLT